ncbi:hypothetical protein [Flavobacterium eburneipallidum]|uniref:hypothetical protein n=1 Tax=Flavobacterium eburneipallidum TaxID=3003263 RepID=UPI0022AC0346|nr:hypothetical protein [Flavobacterium eburneipallidum]
MKIKIALAIITTVLFVSCGPSTQLTKMWYSPTLTTEKVKAYKKVLVIAQLKDETSRRITEDKIVASSSLGNFIPSYQYLKPDQQDQNLVVSSLLKDGIEGIILMRLTDIEKSTSYVPGSMYYGGWGFGRGFYGGFGGWGYGGMGFGGAFGMPGYYQQDKTYYVETNLYDVQTNKLLWAGTTSTINPTKIDKTLDSIILAIKTELIKTGLLQKE